jgi:hypothetical protein
VDETAEQSRLAGEEAVKRGAGDVSLVCQVVHREGIEALRADQLERSTQDALASPRLGLKFEGLEQGIARFKNAIKGRSRNACCRGELGHCRATSPGEQASGFAEDLFPGRDHLIRD